MFEAAELDNRMSREDYDKKLPEVRTRLFNIQQKLKKAQIPVLILVDGIPGAGRGETVNLLNEWMDSRSIRNRTFWISSGDEQQRPEYWRYWRILPGKGEIGIFFGGWYSRLAEKYFRGKLSRFKLDRAINDAQFFERLLTDDGVLIIKLWLHLDEKKHKDMMKKRGENGADPPRFKNKKMSKASYHDIIKIYSKTIRLTDTANAHWHLINCTDHRVRNIAVIETLINSMQSALEHKNINNRLDEPISPATNPQTKYILDSVDLSKTISPENYSSELKKYQVLLNELTIKAFKKEVSTVLLFEGWDAAGKGGAIRRITASIDARLRQTIQIAAPTDEEKDRHYLWRFWRHLPGAGFVTLYDRSWYGRVLVERVEGFASPAEWSRAYEEINSFERQLIEKNIVLVKFFLHISPDEQLRRFKEREECEWKNHKITEDDWRNREKHNDYMEAMNDMFIHTGTDIAPWCIIPAESKHYARVEVLRQTCESITRRLKNL